MLINRGMVLCAYHSPLTANKLPDTLDVSSSIVAAWKMAAICDRNM